MATVIPQPQASVPTDTALPDLEAGDHLDQPTFHARYEAMPPGTRAELVGGRVHMPSPVRPAHGRMQLRVGTWLALYEAATPGVVAADNTTFVLAQDAEPQPDVGLFLPAELGGRVRVNERGYWEGAPELVVEVASSSEAYDLYEKKSDYLKAGVKEYVVVVVRQERIVWFRHTGDRFEEVPSGDDGLFRSQVFPGLWLDPAALLRLDTNGIRTTLELGLASPEHAEFVNQLRGVG